MANHRPADWKNYEDFAAGIDANRLPSTEELAGRNFELTLGSSRMTLGFGNSARVLWREGAELGEDDYDAVLVAPSTYFIDMTFASKPREALSMVVNTATQRAMSVRQIVRERRIEGEPLVEQQFDAGLLSAPPANPSGPVPAETRDLIGLRAFYRYSPRHLYEHVYLSSQRYCWQCLVGEQRGHGDVDLATTWKFDEEQYVFTFREFAIPVASVFFYNFRDMRSTGKFLGLSGGGRLENRKAGAFIRKATVTTYEPGTEPV
jgi:hypothetical protein